MKHTNPHLVIILLMLGLELTQAFGAFTEVFVFLAIILAEFLIFALENDFIQLPSFRRRVLVPIPCHQQNKKLTKGKL